MLRIFLTVVGVAYLLLAVWCVAKPVQTSNAVGLTLQPGSGQSEYLVVYGGLQLALGLFFLWPLLRRDAEPYVLMLCLVLHGCLALLRTISTMAYPGIQSTTYFFAGVEWAIFLGSLWLYFAKP